MFIKWAPSLLELLECIEKYQKEKKSHLKLLLLSRKTTLVFLGFLPSSLFSLRLYAYPCVCFSFIKLVVVFLFAFVSLFFSSLYLNSVSIILSPCVLWFSFLKKLISFLNWRLITLQYVVVFPIHQHESATGIHVFPHLSKFHIYMLMYCIGVSDFTLCKRPQFHTPH